jgi:hypothetical protein
MPGRCVEIKRELKEKEAAISYLLAGKDVYFFQKVEFNPTYRSCHYRKKHINVFKYVKKTKN